MFPNVSVSITSCKLLDQLVGYQTKLCCNRKTSERNLYVKFSNLKIGLGFEKTRISKKIIVVNIGPKGHLLLHFPQNREHCSLV